MDMKAHHDPALTRPSSMTFSTANFQLPRADCRTSVYMPATQPQRTRADYIRNPTNARSSPSTGQTGPCTVPCTRSQQARGLRDAHWKTPSCIDRFCSSRSPSSRSFAALSMQGARVCGGGVHVKRVSWAPTVGQKRLSTPVNVH